MAYARVLAARILWILRPRLPLLLTRPLVARRIRRAVRDRTMLHDAHTQMTYLLADTDHADSIAQASHGYIAYGQWFRELRWHPSAITRQRVEGLEHLSAAYAEGSGVVLSFAHHGRFDGAFASVARAGYFIRVLAGSKAMGQAVGPNMRQHLRVVGMGGDVVPADVGTKGIVKILEAGDIIAIASDVPGSSVVEFAGHTVRQSSGAVRAAAQAGAPIVVMTAHRDANGPYVKLSAPLFPRDFDSVEAVLATLARHQENAILAWPEATFLPNVCWREVTPSADDAGPSAPAAARD